MGGFLSSLEDRLGSHQSYAGAVPPDALVFEGRDGLLYANGKQFHVKGVNWFGSEAFNGPPGGLDQHSVDWYLDFLQRHEFNAIRVLFNHDNVLKDDIVEAPHGAQLFFQTRYIAMFAKLAAEAAKRGILIMIACHRIRGDAWPGAGLWYDPSLGFSEEVVKQSWGKLAAVLCEHWNVFAADLQNEPHASSWAKDPATDWNLAAARIGDHVLDACPRWMIMVEGVGYTPGAPNADDPGAGFWWGENLMGAEIAPVVLQDPRKLVYSPHVYGPSVYPQHYFSSPFFPQNMPAVWEGHFASVQKSTNTPIVIGEIGGRYTDQDRQWQDWALPYCVSRGFGLFYFALNPDSDDTGGLVKKSWVEPGENDVETEKLAALSKLPSTNVFDLCPVCVPSDAHLEPSLAVAASPPSGHLPTSIGGKHADKTAHLSAEQPQRPANDRKAVADHAGTSTGASIGNAFLILIILFGALHLAIDHCPTRLKERICRAKEYLRRKMTSSANVGFQKVSHGCDEHDGDGAQRMPSRYASNRSDLQMVAQQRAAGELSQGFGFSRMVRSKAR
ncbi:hypothetical protein AB1Y20_006922 [Prymnesium parvum]|uniref:Glycoside hydrolase family 5 domain-containing protein n=1 Tax=Prymnesium parvum TaxID=97485 RepID=A0AB34J221_PRYPA